MEWIALAEQYRSPIWTFALAGIMTVVVMAFVHFRITSATKSSCASSSSERLLAKQESTTSISSNIRNGSKSNQSIKREVVKCPFSNNVSFLQESAEHLPLSPLDLYEHWTDHIATRWLTAGLSGQDTPGLLRAGLKRLRHSKHFLVQEPKHMKHDLLLKQKNMDDPVAHKLKFVMEEQSMDAQWETLQLFLAYLPDRYPELYTYHHQDRSITVHPIETTFRIDEWKNRPLELCERIVQEDLVLMRPGKPLEDAKQQHGVEGYYMAAAAVCFSFTKLPEKLGKPVEFIHAPVPGYEAHLRKTMNLLFTKLQPEQPLWRNNWGLSTNGDIDEPLYGSEEVIQGQTIQTKNVTREQVRALFLIVEYQTIRRLPRSGYLLFTIRTMIDPLHALEHVPAKAAQCLAASIRGMSPQMRVYKGIADDHVCAAVLEYLDSIHSPLE